MSEIYALPPQEVYQALNSAPGGLTDEEARRRLDQHGPNELQEVGKTPAIVMFLANFYQVFALLLWVSAALAFVSGSRELGWAIIAVIFINAVFSFWQEYQAERATEALKAILPLKARVLRDGQVATVLARELVPGDVMLLEEGASISADARLVEEFELRTNDAALTGESEPRRRMADPVPPGSLSLIEAPNIVFAGTSVASGSGTAVVFSTGMRTEFGKIAHSTQAVKLEPSPLTKEITRLAYIVAAIAVVSGAVLFGVGFLVAGLSPRDSVVFAIGMITANVPEGLLPTVTLALAIGVRRLARSRALVKRLSSVETLGSTTVICTDKTGTLTQNEMTVREVWVPQATVQVSGVGYEPKGAFLVDGRAPNQQDQDSLRLLLTAIALC
ncbi:MAG TPA: HAD-IC family P-type ATPase, partial [Dehalococcoidia bacterium]|nr:HAD-IC family P-type ATPase [Dehalococcoidia bacterium]